MSRVALGLLVVGAGLILFGWWGIETPAGRRRYDEMAGMIPWGAWMLGWAFAIIGVIWALVSASRGAE